MSKRYDEAIEVTGGPSTTIGPGDTGGSDSLASLPISFSWRGRRYEVDQHLSTWREGAGWRDRVCHRVLARPAGAFASGELDADGFMTTPSAVYDIAFDRIKKVWRLSRIWD